MRRRTWKPPKDPSRMGGMVPRVLVELGYDEQAPGLLVARSWADVVGEPAAAHSEPFDLRGDVLEVRVDSPAWSQHLQARAADILDEIRDRVPQGAPNRLRFHIG